MNLKIKRTYTPAGYNNEGNRSNPIVSNKGRSVYPNNSNPQAWASQPQENMTEWYKENKVGRAFVAPGHMAYIDSMNTHLNNLPVQAQ